MLVSCKFSFTVIFVELAVKAIYPFNFYSGSSVCPATVWIVFTKILNVILAS